MKRNAEETHGIVDALDERFSKRAKVAQARKKNEAKITMTSNDAETESDVKSVALAIVGSRTFLDYDDLKKKTEALINFIQMDGKEKVVKIVSGGAKGADSLGAKYATEIGIPCENYLPDWNAHGRKAGILRNFDILKACDYMIAFWKGNSPGTQHTITEGKKMGKMTVRGKNEYDKCCFVY